MQDEPAVAPEAVELLTELIADRAGVTPSGAVGARWGAKFLKNETATTQVTIEPQRIDDAVARVADLLDTTPQQDGETVTLLGVVGSGVFDMNPAVVRVEIGARGEVVVAAYGMEGLIKQKTAKKAVAKVEAALA